MHFRCAESLDGCTCVRLKVLYMKHYNSTQANLITHSIYHSVPSPPLHPHMCTPPLSTHTHTHTRTHSLTSPHVLLSLPVSLLLSAPPIRQNYQSASEDVSRKVTIKSNIASGAFERVRVVQSNISEKQQSVCKNASQGMSTQLIPVLLGEVLGEQSFSTKGS